MNTTCSAVTADVVLPGRPFQLHRLGGPQRTGGIPFAEAQEDALAVVDLAAVHVAPSSTPNSTRPPSAARRCTCEAMGTVRPPANSSGSRNREYCEGIPASGRARTDPACQNTAASAADSWRRYQTALPSRISTACKAPASSSTSLSPPYRHPTPPTPAPPAPAGPPRPRRPDSEQGSLQVGRQRARHRESERPVGPDHGITRVKTAMIRPNRSSRETPMRPINLPAYGKVEACPRFRRTSPSAA